MQTGERDFGNIDKDYSEDARILTSTLETLFKHLLGPPYVVIDRKRRSLQKADTPTKQNKKGGGAGEINSPEAPVNSQIQNDLISGKDLLYDLCNSEGHANVSSFSLLTRPKIKAANPSYWAADGVKGKSLSPRSRAYLAGYWILSERGKNFLFSGIPTDGKFLVADKAVMRRFIRDGYIDLDIQKKCFAFTVKGTDLVQAVLSKAGIRALSH